MPTRVDHFTTRVVDGRSRISKSRRSQTQSNEVLGEIQARNFFVSCKPQYSVKFSNSINRFPLCYLLLLLVHHGEHRVLWIYGRFPTESYGPGPFARMTGNISLTVLEHPTLDVRRRATRTEHTLQSFRVIPSCYKWDPDSWRRETAQTITIAPGCPNPSGLS